MADVTIEIRDADVSGILEIKDSDTFPLSLSKNYSDLIDLTKRGGSFSTTFKVPATKQNNILLDHAYNTNGANPYDVDKELRCTINVDGSTIETGFLKLKNVTTKGGVREYSFSFLGDNLNWVNELKSKYLKDLPFANNSILYDQVTVKNSWANSVISGDEWVFSLINRGKRYQANNVAVQDLLPDLFLKPLIDKMVALSGYTINSVFMDENKFKHLILTFFGRLFTLSEELVNSNFVRAGKLVSHLKDDNIPLFDALGASLYVPIDNIYNETNGLPEPFLTSPSPFIDTNNNLFVDTYTAPVNAFYLVNFVGTATITNSIVAGYLPVNINGGGTFNQGCNFNNMSGTFYMEINGTTRQDFPLYVSVPSASDVDSSGIFGVLPGASDYIYLNQGDTLTIKYEIEVNDLTQIVPGALTVNPASDMDVDIRVNPIIDFSVEVLKKIPVGHTFTLTDVLDDEVKLLDLVNDVSRMFNLHWEVNNFNKTIRVEPRDQFYDSITEAEDWSDKLDIQSDYTVGFNSNEYTEVLDFEYKDDSSDGYLEGWEEDYNIDWASYTHNFPDKFKNGTSKVSTSVLAASSHIQDKDALVDDSKAPFTTRIWSEYGASAPDFSNNHAPRILNYLYAGQSGKEFIFGGVTETLIPMALMSKIFIDNLQIAAVLDNLHFEDYASDDGLVTEHYGNAVKTIEEGMFLKARVRLNTSDWLGIKPSMLVYFDERFADLKGYWTVEKVSGYKPNKPGLVSVQLRQFKVFETLVAGSGGGEGGTSGATSNSMQAQNPASSSLFSTGSTTNGTLSELSPITPSIVLQNGSGNTAVQGSSSVAIGNFLTSTGRFQTVLGNYNVPNNGDIFQIGSGTDPDNRVNALTINNNGEMKFYGGEVYMEDDTVNGTNLFDVLIEIDGELKQVYL